MIAEKHTQQIWILLAESFLSVVSELSQPFWFVGKLIFRVRLADRQSSCTYMYISSVSWDSCVGFFIKIF